jgi:hypothetical protein
MFVWSYTIHEHLFNGQLSYHHACCMTDDSTTAAAAAVVAAPATELSDGLLYCMMPLIKGLGGAQNQLYNQQRDDKVPLLLLLYMHTSV